MDKKEAKQLLGVDSQGLADSLGISEGHVRNLKDLKPTYEIIVNSLVEIDRLDKKCTELRQLADDAIELLRAKG